METEILVFFRVMASLECLQLCCPVCFPTGGLGVCSASELSSYSENVKDGKTALFPGTRSTVKGRDGSNRADVGGDCSTLPPLRPINLSNMSFFLSITDPFSLDFLPVVPSLHRISKHGSAQSLQEDIFIHGAEVQVQPSLHNLFLIAH